MDTLADIARKLDLPGYEGIYTIDENGVVHNTKRDRPVAVDTSNRHGYHRVNLFGQDGRKRMFVHRLVNQTFASDQWDPSRVVDHIDGNKVNNHYSNLRNISQSDNTLAAIALGLRVYNKKGSNNEVTAIPGERLIEG